MKLNMLFRNYEYLFEVLLGVKRICLGILCRVGTDMINYISKYINNTSIIHQ